MNASNRPVAVVIGATSKWQSDGRNTRLIHGGDIDDSELPVGVRWGVGGAIAQKFAQEGFLTVLTTCNAGNAAALRAAIGEHGGREHHRRVGSVIARLDIERVRPDTGTGGRAGRAGLQRGLHRGARSSALRRARPWAGSSVWSEHRTFNPSVLGSNPSRPTRGVTKRGTGLGRGTSLESVLGIRCDCSTSI